MPEKCLRGAVIEVDLEPVVGHEQAKTRPCAVVQNDTSNAFSATTIVAPITRGGTHQEEITNACLCETRVGGAY
jgi:mRNA interferase MazF